MDDLIEIHLDGVGKRFRRWVFTDLNYRLAVGQWYGLVGHNGIGKSTLLSIISGYTATTSGSVSYINSQGRTIAKDRWPQYISYAAPYVELVEELSVAEMITFHYKFCPPKLSGSLEEVLARLQLQSFKGVPVSDLSSGLKQRLQLGLAILTDKTVLLLDEPTSYLDSSSRNWFHEMMLEYASERMVVIATNNEDDLVNCGKKIELQQFIAV